jgi:predicted HTH transcriptional regulator
MTGEQLGELLVSLTRLPHETEWLEFKVDDADPQTIGEYISALANSAALHQKESAYLVWGVEDSSHRIVGTSFKPRDTKVGNEELENWLTRSLTPQVDFYIHEFVHEQKPVVLFHITQCRHQPIRFKDAEFIRIGSYKKRLKDHPEKERALWAQLTKTSFEKEVAVAEAHENEVLSKLDYPAYFELSSQPLPPDKSSILRRLETERLIQRRHGVRWDITGLGAILFAKKLTDFDSVARKAVRVVVYKDRDRTRGIKEQVESRGYAAGFQGLISYINDQLPTNEEIVSALRTDVKVYPELAIRELVANALIHQDLTVRGDGPMIEIFSDRIEITNPGKPLINPLRFIDEPPQSRNEALAAFMRRMNVCEERGSGIDKVIFQVELFQLPGPDFRATENHTKVILFAPRKLSGTDRQDRIRACYQHACLLYVSSRRMTNTTLRKRFSIEEKNYAVASRIIQDTIQEKLIRAYDPDSASKKYASYVPFWA